MLSRLAASLNFRLSTGGRRLANRWHHLRASIGPQPQSKFSRFVNDLAECAGGLEGKRLLEIGSDPDGRLLHEALRKGRVSMAVGVNPAIDQELREPSIQLLKADAGDLDFSDGSFDVIASLSSFEHVFDLPRVLRETFRILVPGGVLFAEFGPIWSSCWGHHLWLYHGGRVVDWRTHALPPYAHLLMSPAELEAWCNIQFDDRELSGKIVSYVFESEEQNRLFYSDYMQIVSESPFETMFFCGDPDVPHPTGTPRSDYAADFSRLNRRYPGKSGFGYHLIRLMLAKPHSSE